MKRDVEDVDGWAMKRKKVSADGSEAIYHCVLRRREHGCHGSFALNLQTSTIRIIRQHSRHDKDEDLLRAEQAKDKLRSETVARPNDRPRDIIDAVRTNLSSKAANLFGSYYSTRRIIQYARPLDSDQVAANTIPAELEGKYRETLDGKAFVLSDETCQVSKKRRIIFGSDGCLHILRQSKIVIADGTFDCVPQPFTQLLTIHCDLMNGIIKPVIFVLMMSKETKHYLEVLMDLKKHPMLLSWIPEHIITDFELSLRNSFQYTFPSATMLPGGFLREFWMLLRSLPFCPPSMVLHMFETIVRLLPGPLSLLHLEFICYVKNNYIGSNFTPARFKIEHWNCYLRTRYGIPQISNAAEAFHKVLSNVTSMTYGLRSVKMSDLLDAIRREDAHTTADNNILSSNPAAIVSARKKSCFIERDRHLQQVMTNHPTPPMRPLQGIELVRAIAACLERYP